MGLLLASGQVEQNLGRWEQAREHLQRARDLDPRSWRAHSNLGQLLIRLRRYREARELLERGLAFAPTNLDLILIKAMTYLGEGDLSGSRGVLASVPKEVEPTALVAYFANAWDLHWVLDEPRRELLLRLTPVALYDDRGLWGLVMAQAYALLGQKEEVKKYAEEARRDYERQSAEAPNDAQRHLFLGLALAYLGREVKAVAEGERALALTPITKDARGGPYYQHQVVRIHILLGHQEKALDLLEPLLKIPSFLSPGWLKVDPNFDPLRQNPRFQRLLAGR